MNVFHVKNKKGLSHFCSWSGAKKEGTTIKLKALFKFLKISKQR